MPKEIIKRDANRSGRVQEEWGCRVGGVGWGGRKRQLPSKESLQTGLLLTDDTILGNATFCSPPGQK